MAVRATPDRSPINEPVYWVRVTSLIPGSNPFIKFGEGVATPIAELSHWIVPGWECGNYWSRLEFQGCTIDYANIPDEPFPGGIANQGQGVFGADGIEIVRPRLQRNATFAFVGAGNGVGAGLIIPNGSPANFYNVFAIRHAATSVFRLDLLWVRLKIAGGFAGGVPLTINFAKVTNTVGMITTPFGTGYFDGDTGSNPEAGTQVTSGTANINTAGVAQENGGHDVDVLGVAGEYVYEWKKRDPFTIDNALRPGRDEGFVLQILTSAVLTAQMNYVVSGAFREVDPSITNL